MATHQLNYACQPLINEIVGLEALNEKSKDQALSQLQQSAQQLKQRAKAQNCDPQDVKEASYALAALIDEQVPLRCPKLAGLWRSALMQTMFGENRGGDGFFERLTKILQESHRQEALGIFALCLAYGFRGRFSERGRGELAQIRARVRRTLQRNPCSVDLQSTLPPSALGDSPIFSNKRLIWPLAIVLCLTVITMATVRKGLDQTSETLLRRLPKVLEQNRFS